MSLPITFIFKSKKEVTLIIVFFNLTSQDNGLQLCMINHGSLSLIHRDSYNFAKSLPGKPTKSIWIDRTQTVAILYANFIVSITYMYTTGMTS